MVRINEEIRKEYTVKPPPSHLIFEYGKDSMAEYMEKHGYAMESSYARRSDEAKERVEAIKREGLDFYIKEEAMEKILRHCHEQALKGRESMGFLVGDVRKWDDIYAVVYDIATASLEASSVYVRFHREAFEELFDALDEIEYEYVLLGWYHSHLGYSSFMSSIDMETQRTYFTQPYHAALVVDPITREMKAFRIINEECVEIPYAIFR